MIADALILVWNKGNASRFGGWSIIYNSVLLYVAFDLCVKSKGITNQQELICYEPKTAHTSKTYLDTVDEICSVLCQIENHISPMFSSWNLHIQIWYKTLANYHFFSFLIQWLSILCNTDVWWGAWCISFGCTGYTQNVTFGHAGFFVLVTCLHMSRCTRHVKAIQCLTALWALMQISKPSRITFSCFSQCVDFRCRCITGDMQL